MSQWVTRSPIELFWTANKKHCQRHNGPRNWLGLLTKPLVCKCVLQTLWCHFQHRIDAIHYPTPRSIHNHLIPLLNISHQCATFNYDESLYQRTVYSYIYFKQGTTWTSNMCIYWDINYIDSFWLLQRWWTHRMDSNWICWIYAVCNEIYQSRQN